MATHSTLSPLCCTMRVCRRSPGRGGPARLFSSIAELNSGGFPERQDSNIHTFAHQYQNFHGCVQIHIYTNTNEHIFKSGSIFIHICVWIQKNNISTLYNTNKDNTPTSTHKHHHRQRLPTASFLPRNQQKSHIFLSIRNIIQPKITSS